MGRVERRARKQANKALARQAEWRDFRRRRRRRWATRLVALAAVAGLVATGALAIFGDDDGTTTTTTLPDPTTTTLPEELAAVECTDEVPETAGQEKPQFDAPPETDIDPDKAYRATIETSCGTIVAELDAAAAPVGVNNFVFLARRGFYDGLTFHRVIVDFVVQGGDPAGDGTGGPGYQLPDEIPEGITYEIGDLAYANSGPNTNGSQFFVVTGPSGPEALNPQASFTTFGRVVDGLEVAQRMSYFEDPNRDPTVPASPPTRPLYIFSITIEESD